jgi:type II secretory pathway pseudopilin PulG
MEQGLNMHTSTRDQSGFSLLETVFAIGILSVGALGMAGTFTTGMQRTLSSPNELIATQKAAEAIESVFSARDSHTIAWAQLRNEAYGGIFLNGPQPLKTAGADGVVNTHDDGPAIESFDLPGKDQLLGTPDDVTQTLDGFTREIKIADISDDLRSVTVTVIYKAGAETRSYSLTAYISTWA